MKALHIIAFILIAVGGLAWGIYGIWGVMIVGYLGMTVAKVVYILVGLAALWEIFTHKSNCKACGMGGMQKPMM